MDDSSSEEYVSADEGPAAGGLEEPTVSPVPEEVKLAQHPGTSSVSTTSKAEGEVAVASSALVNASDDVTVTAQESPPGPLFPSEHTPISPEHKDLADPSVEETKQQSSAMVTTPLTEEAPVPPPRRKRKIKNKQPSLENLDEDEVPTSFRRSLTLGSSDLDKELVRPLAPSPNLETAPQPSNNQFNSTNTTSDPPTSITSDVNPPTSITSVPTSTTSDVSLPTSITSDVSPSTSSTGDIRPATSTDTSTTSDALTSEDTSTSGGRGGAREGSTPRELTQAQEGISTDISHLTVSTSNDSLTQERLSRSRSVTPTPAISIEPDLQWTADMLSIPESEVVTSDTSLAKARGSNTTTTSSVAFPSDDDSLDGDLVFGDDTPEEGGGADSEGGGADSEQTQPSSQEAAVALPTEADTAILESTMVTNLDTGEVIPLSAAEERIPQGHGWSPLSEHLIRRTEAEGRSGCSYEDEDTHHRRKARKKAFSKIKKWGRKRGGEETTTQSDEAQLYAEDKFAVKYKQASHKQNRQEFDKVRLKQDLTGIHLGAIWSMEFSICGRLLATAGQDSVVRVWVLATAAIFFHELQTQYQHLGVHSSVDSLSEKASVASSGSNKSSEEDDSLGGKLPFQEQPLCSYYGHTADVLDLSWSKNFFLLSSSMDKTVRLWHISRKECLCCFQHVDFVTAIAFHPRDDRYFLSGSLDGKLRLWNIPDKRVALWNEIEGVGSHLITAANFCMNGKLAVVGTYDGRCMFYDTEHLKYHTQIHVKSRHGKNKGRKISGVEPLPGEDKLLVTSNDSRVRLYNLKDHELSCKYKGCLNTSSQIKATFSRDGQYIISGSEDNFIYLWKTHQDLSKLSSGRKDRNEYYEAFSSHSAPVTTAVFAPVPGITVDEGIKEVGEMVVAADYQGSIKIYVSGEKL